MRTKQAIVFATLAVALLIAACSSSNTTETTTTKTTTTGNPTTTTGGSAGDVTAGKKVFSATCAGCHGADATGGHGPAIKGNQFVQSKSESELAAFIKTGRPDKGMPPKGGNSSLTDNDVANVAAYEKSLQN